MSKVMNAGGAKAGWRRELVVIPESVELLGGLSISAGFNYRGHSLLRCFPT